MRARSPDRAGVVDIDGVEVHWERTGVGEPALLFVGVDPIVDSGMWKGQVPWFARRHTVVTFDPPGNGGSARPTDPAACTDVLDSDEGWAKENRHDWLRDRSGYCEFFFAELLPEPHSTKPLEDCVGWGLRMTPEIMLAYLDANATSERSDPATSTDVCRRVRCPVLVVHEIARQLDRCSS